MVTKSGDIPCHYHFANSISICICAGLPTTKLATFLEDRINNFLLHKVGPDHEWAGHVTIRVVSSSDKMLETRMLMKERFGTDFPSQFPYRTKAMFAFEKIDGVDVCFFGMHVQEYGSDCQAPNTRYICDANAIFILVANNRGKNFKDSLGELHPSPHIQFILPTFFISRCVYISYLDSVHFFRPRIYRTDVCYEILIGYLDFCKSNGYISANY